MDKWKQVRYDQINTNGIQFSFSIVYGFACSSNLIHDTPNKQKILIEFCSVFYWFILILFYE